MAYSTTFVKLYMSCAQRKRSNSRGFTLTELLVAIVVAGIIIAGLLYVAVQMIKIDREELVLSETQQNTRRAMDYVTRELQEAVFVYPTEAATLAVVNRLNNTPPDGTPIVSFWRVDPMTPAQVNSIANCNTDACQVLRLRQSFYTLVTYFVVDNDDDPIWEGPARIVRQQVTPYTEISGTNVTRRGNFLDPVSTTFEGWPAELTANINAPNGVVLTDGIDFSVEDANVPTCEGAYSRVPATEDENRFFVCVRDPVLSEAAIEALDVDLLEGEIARDNQDLIVFMRGNATDNRAGLFTTFSERSRLPTLESRVLVRGILDKRPQ